MSHIAVCHREWIFKASLDTPNFHLTALKSLENTRFSFQASFLPCTPKGRLPPLLLHGSDPVPQTPGQAEGHSHSLLQLLLLLLMPFLQFFQLCFYVILVSKQLRDKRRGR